MLHQQIYLLCFLITGQVGLYLDMFNTIGTVVNINKTMINTEAILSQKPALAISAICNSPELKTIAFGGVATGIINAQLAANAAGITNISGPSVKVTEIGPSKGKKLATVAVLLVT